MKKLIYAYLVMSLFIGGMLSLASCKNGHREQLPVQAEPGVETPIQGEKTYSIRAGVYKALEQKRPDLPTRGFYNIHYPEFKAYHLYPIEDADVYVLKEGDTIARCKSSLDTFMVFKNMLPGKYVIVGEKEGYKKGEEHLVLKDSVFNKIIVPLIKE